MTAASSCSKRARVLSREPGRISFAVDPVKASVTRLPVEEVHSRIEQRTERKFYFVSAEGGIVKEKQYSHSLLADAGLHPLLQAVHVAFAEHRPLELTPDDFALVIAQGFSHHVNANAEQLRGLLVDHEGKNTIIVKVNEWGTREAWEMIVDAFSDRLQELVNASATGIFNLDYSTTTKAARIAGEIAMMEAFQKYFDYVLACVCGIPHNTLRGTSCDWSRLKERVLNLDAFGLSWWTSRVIPILDECIATAGGEPDLDFWQAIIKPQKTYGGELISGWMADLFPYLTSGGPSWKAEHVNPVLRTERKGWILESGGCEGIRPASFPPGISETQVRLTGLVNKTVALAGGFLGCVQSEDGTLRTETGWGLGESDASVALMTRLVSGGYRFERWKETPRHTRFLMDGNGLMAALNELEGYLRLFPGTASEWHVGNLGPAFLDDREIVALPGVSIAARRIDGVSIGVIRRSREMSERISKLDGAGMESEPNAPWMVLLGKTRRSSDVADPLNAKMLDLLEDVVELDTDLTSALTHILDSEGEIPAFVPEGSRAR